MSDTERAEKLAAAIRTHRDQRLDDRCWLDDQKLYAALDDGNTGDNRTPPAEEMLKNCARFIAQRCSPGKWQSYQELERRIELLKPLADAGFELAQYASYAEIVGGVRHNRAQIREWCDKVYALQRAIDV